jgi:hypothetical protein
VPQAKDLLLWRSHFCLAPVPHGVGCILFGAWAHEFCSVRMSGRPEVRSGLMTKIMTALPLKLSAKGGIDVREAFIDASFRVG